MEIKKDYADEKAIMHEIGQLKSVIPFCQNIYNSFKAIGIPVKITDMGQIAGQCLRGTDDQFLREYLRNLMVDTPKYSHLKGATETLKSREIVIPDYSDIQQWIVKNWPEGFVHNRVIPTKHLELKDGKVIMLALSEEATRKKHTQKHLVHDPDAVAESHAKGEHIVIQHDEHHIANAIGDADEAIHDGQQVYDMFKAMGVEVNLNEIHNLLHAYDKLPSDHIHNLVADKLLAKAGPQSFNGIPIKREKLKEMIAVPDVSHIGTRIKQLTPHWHHGGGKTFKPEYLQIKDGKLAYADGFHDGLNNKHIHTTKTEHGLNVAATLMKASKMVIELADAFGKTKKGNHIVSPLEFTIPGLKTVTRNLAKDEVYSIAGKRFEKEFVGHRIDLDFIREQEKTAAIN